MPDETQRQNSGKLHPEKLQTADQPGAGREAGPSRDDRDDSDRDDSGRADSGRADSGETPEHTYEPSPIEVNRARERGLGGGQKDIDYQHDPTGATPAERWVNPEPPPRVRPPDPLPPDLDPPPDN
jgi:hypothetical protein